MEKEYTYSAFISYSSKDKKTAKYLWKKLERYRLPAALQKQYEEIPAKMHVFLDKTDIVPSGSVEKSISRELADSKKLIVICSPNSAKSEYVELEVKNFLAFGHSKDDIIPYIIKGTVGNSKKNNCYVPSLLGKDGKDTVNGVSVIRDGKWSAFVSVLAGVLGLKRDEIYQREKVRRNRLIATYSALGTVAACFIGALAWYITPHTKYYADYVTRWGVPEGIGKELSKSEIKSRFAHYEITSQYGKIIKLVYANSLGHPNLQSDNFLEERQNRPTIAEYTYKNMYFPQLKKQQELTETRYTIATGTNNDFIRNYSLMLVYSGKTENSLNIDFYYDNKERLQKSLSNDVFSRNGMYYSDILSLSASRKLDKVLDNEATKFFVEDVSSIYRHKIWYDENGYEKQIDFYNKNNRPTSDKNGIKGVQFEYDKNKRIVKEQYVYENYTPTSIISKNMQYGETGNLIEVTYSGIDSGIENPGIKKIKNNKQTGFAKKTIKWDDGQKNPVEYRFFDEKDSPSPQKHLSNCVIRLFEYDDRGFQRSEKRVSDKGIQTIAQMQLNDDGLPIDLLAIEGEKQILHAKTEYNDDFHMTKNIFYDATGNETQRVEYSYKYENEEQKIIQTKVIYGKQIYQTDIFDKFGRYIESRVGQEDNVHGLISKIDYKGDNRSICYYFADGKTYYDEKYAPSNEVWKGYARADFAYNNDGKLVYAAFKDRLGRASNCNLEGMNFSTYTATYSPNGILLDTEYRKANGDLVDGKDVDSVNAPYYHAITDIDDSFVIRAWSNIRVINYSTNDNDEVIVTQRFRDGEIIDEKVYKDKKLIKTRLYDHPQENGDYKVFTYDNFGRFIQSEYCGADGILKNRPNKNYSSTKTTYLENGEKYIDFTDEKGFLVTKFLYDEFGKEEKTISYKNDGTYIEQFVDANKNTMLKEYDAQGTLLSEVVYNFSDDGSYTVSGTNYRDNTVSVSYFDKNKTARNNSEGWARKERRYIDGQNRTTYKNAKRETIFCKSGYIIRIMEVFPDSLAMKAGVQKDDILLVLGNFDYFATGTLADFDSNQSDEEKRCVIYSPLTKQITELHGKSFGFSFKEVYPTDDEESSLQYIAQIKSAYGN